MSMNAPTVRVLRIAGLPPEMASRAVDAVLRTDRDVLAIDAIEPGPTTQAHVLHVVVEGSGVERIRRKLATGFTFVDVEDVTDTSAAARSPARVSMRPRRPKSPCVSGPRLWSARIHDTHPNAG
jgi:hypothetical protein